MESGVVLECGWYLDMVGRAFDCRLGVKEGGENVLRDVPLL